MKTRAIAYLRVSTDKQADHGVSLAAQRCKVEAYASLYDLEIVEVIEDAGGSAKTLKRDGLQRALALLDAGKADALIVAKLDRLTRSTRDLGTLLDGYFSQRFDLLSVGEQVDTRSAGGRLVLNVLMSVAQWEREAIGERTSAAMQHKARNGEYTGGRPPYGSQLAADGIHLAPHDGEQLVIAAVRELRSAGLSLRAIAAELGKRSLLSRKGRPLNHTQVRRILAA
jgi:site-specific DNA recombinase